MDQQISLKPGLTDLQVGDDTKIVPWCVGANGFVNKATVLQIKKVMATQYVYYTGLGSEGTVLTISALAAQNIIAIFKEGMLLYPVVSAPDTVSYIWDSTNITFGLAINLGERYAILYKG